MQSGSWPPKNTPNHRVLYPRDHLRGYHFNAVPLMPANTPFLADLP